MEPASPSSPAPAQLLQSCLEQHPTQQLLRPTTRSPVQPRPPQLPRPAHLEKPSPVVMVDQFSSAPAHQRNSQQYLAVQLKEPQQQIAPSLPQQAVQIQQQVQSVNGPSVANLEARKLSPTPPSSTLPRLKQPVPPSHPPQADPFWRPAPLRPTEHPDPHLTFESHQQPGSNHVASFLKAPSFEDSFHSMPLGMDATWLRNPFGFPSAFTRVSGGSTPTQIGPGVGIMDSSIPRMSPPSSIGSSPFDTPPGLSPRRLSRDHSAGFFGFPSAGTVGIGFMAQIAPSTEDMSDI